MGYKTVAGYGCGEIVEKKSRFIGQAWPVKTEEEARAILEETRKKYWDASHNVFAYRVGSVQRFSDDGEPSGTSGKPTLDVITGAGLENVMIIVTRYFGGTLLGTGGLVRAYTKGAQTALAAAGIMEKKIFVRCSLSMDYGYLSKLQYLTAKHDWHVEDTIYADQVTMRLVIPEEETEAFGKEVTAASDGRLQVTREGRIWGAKVPEGVRLFDDPI